MSARSVARRLGRIERADARLGCAVCQGAGRVTAVRAHLEPVPAKPEACPGCGKWTLIVVRRAETIRKDLAFKAQVRFCSKAELRT